MQDARHVLIYDGDCSFCVQFKEGILRRDRDERVEALPFQDTAVSLRFPLLKPEDLKQRFHLIAPDGTVRAGAEALPILLTLLPSWRWAGLALSRLPASVSRALYYWLSSRRGIK